MKGLLFDNDLCVELRILNDGISGLVIGETTHQNERIILLTQKGEVKDNPTTGVGITDFINDDSPEMLLREIRTQLSQDGMSVKSVGVNKVGNIEIEAKYN